MKVPVAVAYEMKLGFEEQAKGKSAQNTETSAST